jgi:hypothetical protein
LSIFLFKFLDDHEQFFDLSLVAADELDILVDLSSERGYIIVTVFDCQQLFELHKG